jgi:hypothetical protein
MSDYLQYRFSILKLVPRWLKGTIGAKLLYTIGCYLDELGDEVDQGVKLSFAYKGSGPGGALSLLGQAHGITRGPGELDDSYELRLAYWRLSRRRKGNAFALLEQLQAYLQPYSVSLRIQYDSGTRYTLPPNSWTYAPSGYVDAPSECQPVFAYHAWNWDGTRAYQWDFTQQTNRFWILIYNTVGTLWSTDGTWGDAGLWNDLNTVDGTVTTTVLDPLSTDTTPTYGSTASYSTVQAIVSLVRDWTPPHAECMGVIYCFTEDSFDNLAPDGTWNLPGERDPSVVYWE